MVVPIFYTLHFGREGDDLLFLFRSGACVGQTISQYLWIFYALRALPPRRMPLLPRTHTTPFHTTTAPTTLAPLPCPHTATCQQRVPPSRILRLPHHTRTAAATARTTRQYHRDVKTVPCILPPRLPRTALGRAAAGRFRSGMGLRASVVGSSVPAHKDSFCRAYILLPSPRAQPSSGLNTDSATRDWLLNVPLRADYN